MNDKPSSLYPAILTDSLDILNHQVDLVKNMEGVETVQIDIIDGYFADELTITPDDLLETDFEPLKLDFHLMVNEPLDFVLETAVLAASLPIRGVIAQVERMTSQAEYLEEVKHMNWLKGLALDLHTPLESINEESWAELNIVQLMGIEAGAQGQAFVPLVLAKIKAARDYITQHNLDIELLVDGGIKVTNVKSIVAEGATGLVVGSELWEADDSENVAGLLQE